MSSQILADKRKQSLYFPEDMLTEIAAEAKRQDRSMSWVVQQAWKIARGEITTFPPSPGAKLPVAPTTT